jgi:hypothetical protein
MAKRLFVAVLGLPRSGKSTTWNQLFGRRVSTGALSRKLRLSASECVEVFLISGSNEERDTYAGTSDRLAHHITRLAGDVVELDPIEQLLIGLQRAGRIDRVQMVRLQARYLREAKP